MLRSAKWALSLAAVGTLGLLSAGASSGFAQDEGKPGGRERPQAGGTQRGGQERPGDRAGNQERMAKFKESVNAAKIPLSAAIATVEKEHKGKVFRAQYSIGKDGKFAIDVGFLAEDKMGSVSIDPETGKAGAPKFEGGGRPGGQAAGGDDGGGN